jgi:hypothetical protein
MTDARYEAQFIPQARFVPDPIAWGTLGAAASPATGVLNETIGAFLREGDEKQ